MPASELIYIAGPCVLESETIALDIAKELQDIVAEHPGDETGVARQLNIFAVEINRTGRVRIIINLRQHALEGVDVVLLE